MAFAAKYINIDAFSSKSVTRRNLSMLHAQVPSRQRFNWWKCVEEHSHRKWKSENGKSAPGAICIVSQNAGLTTFDGWKLLKIKGRQRALAERCTSRRSVRDPKTGFEGWKVGRRVEIGRGGAYL